MDTRVDLSAKTFLILAIKILATNILELENQSTNASH